MRRRQFLTALGCQMMFPPTIVSAQPQGKLPIVGILDPAVGDPSTHENFPAFKKQLLEYGWIDGTTIRLERRLPGINKERLPIDATELINLAPNVLVVSSTFFTSVLAERTRQIPIVFISVAEAILAGFSDSLARPSRNMTGFTLWDPAMSSKVCQLLKEVKPDIRRVTAMHDPVRGGSRQLASIFLARFKQASKDMNLEFNEAQCSDAVEIEAAMGSLGQDDGLFVAADPTMYANRRLIIDLAARYRVAATYAWNRYVREGGLMAYTVDQAGLWRSAAGYVDRLLKGTKVEELPIQQPTTFDLDINLATAKALGLTVPATLLAQATHLIE